MLATQDSHLRLTQAPLAVAAFVRMLLESVVAVGCLAGCVVAFGQPFANSYMILALLVFSLTFPGRPPRGTSPAAVAREVLTDWILIVGLLLMLGWATRMILSFDERVIVAWIAITPVVMFGAQLLVPVMLPRLLAAEGLKRVAVVAGAGTLGRQLAERIAETPMLGVTVAGFFDDRATDRIDGGARDRVLGSVEELADYVKKNRVDLIYVTLPMSSQPRIVKLCNELRDTTASIYFVPDIFVFDLIQGRMDSIGGIPVMAVCETPFFGVNAMVKRISDIVLATLILILISPALLAIAAIVKLTSPGPALFKQRRYGLDGREVIVYKFRSMRVAEDGPVVKQATKDDPRVTPFGAFMRRPSLDELPQFINVLQGRMSIVGPRPHAIAHNEQYRKLVKGYMLRHKVRPGITGWAQVNGMRGETETVDKMMMRIEYDLEYLRHWSLKLDLQIIWRTIFVV
ncbi:MAG TPA: undecaprenyl-phosphate glucose phosphotransferase, partial [Usitatibacter sp.]|nr:undecaprenyl-phosphate glucose phosphotransferase [Usitatibacter sp.]